MRILMLCEFYNEELTFQENLLAKYYVKHGHAVTIVTSTYESVFDYYSDRHDNRTPPRTYHQGGVKIIKLRYRYNILHRIRAYTRIDGILEEEKPDLVYVHDIMPNFPEAIAYVVRHPSARMIMDYHADYSNSGRNRLSLLVLHGILRKWFLDRARPHLSRIFPVVPASTEFLHQIYGVPLEEMEVLPLGADTDYCEDVRNSKAREELRENYRLGPSDVVAFTGGKLNPTKMTEILLEAAGICEDLRLHVFVAGDAAPTDAAYKKTLLEYADRNPRVRFLGWLNKENMHRFMAMADLAVFPASQSVVWQQAIAMGLPLIAGDVGHQDASYLNLHNNVVVIPRERISARGFADAIREVVSTPGRMSEMTRGAIRTADEYLNWNKLIYRTLRFNAPFQSPRSQ